jgi:hypothetical protein
MGRQIGRAKKDEKTTWQRHAEALSMSNWRADHDVSVRFRALSSEIGGQELFPYQTSGWIYLERKVRDVGLLR